MTHTWESLNALTVARQFPDTALPVTALAERVGPLQTQTARSAYVGLGARSPSADHVSVTAAYEAADLVRGSLLRGTVHTTTRAHHRLLDVATRLQMRDVWRRLGVTDPDTQDLLCDRIEEHARHEWRTAGDLKDHLGALLAERGLLDSVAALDAPGGRYLAFRHGGLVRRPLRGGWAGQGAAGYRAAEEVTGLPLPPQQEALRDLLRLHLRAHGPATRHDLAWWSGLRVTEVDRVLAGLDDELSSEPGPDRRTYLDLPGSPSGRTLDDVRLLPEFDAVFCAYQPAARGRFVTPEHHAVLWSSANLLVRPPLLVDGRVAGWWRAAGSARRRPLEVTWFRGTRKPRRSELEAAVARLEASLDVTVTSTSLDRAG